LSRAVLVIYSVCSDQSVNAELDQNNWVRWDWYTSYNLWNWYSEVLI
jgi:hypothetical protein